VDPAILPPDAVFKGYDKVVVEDVLVRTDNVLFRKEVYYSATESKTYMADMPPGYQGRYGPGIRALSLALYFGGPRSGPKILDFFASVGIAMSSGYLSDLLVKDQTVFHAEKDAIFEAGLRSSAWQHIDDTVTRVDGQNQYCHIVCHPLYTAYLTTPRKDRLTIVDVLRNGRERCFLLNAEALDYLERMGLGAIHRERLQRLPHDERMDSTTVDRLLHKHLPGLGPRQHQWVLTAMAIAAYHAQLEWPVIDLLIADDAPQFRWVTTELALCWVHEGRHYKKLSPFVPVHHTMLDEFLDQFWTFYHDLLAYRQQPSLEARSQLDTRFDELFGTVTGYAALDDRIAKTLVKKEALLKVLDHPEIPLHNNPAELGARARVRKRLVSFGPRSSDGVRAWDTFMTLAATTKKLGFSLYHYIHDRVSHTNAIPCLADLIDQRAADLNLAPTF
jgi:hypothetical protein